MDKCSVCGTTKKLYSKNNKFGKILCAKHYKQMIRHKKTFRTRYDKNEIVKRDCFAEVFLYNSKGEIIAKAKIDLEDIEKIKPYKWHFNNGYARNTKNNQYMHQLLCDGEEIDHANRDTLDNRKENLRASSHSDNITNKSKQSNNTSGIAGVFWDKERSKWRVEIQYNNKKYYIGRFDDFETACFERLKAEVEIMPKDFAPNRHLYKKYNLAK